MEWFKKYKELVFSERTSVDKIDKAISLKYEHLPRKLYKYRSVNEYSLKNLEEGSIWLSDPKSFNDPYDCSFHHEVELDSDNADSVLSRAHEHSLISELTTEQIQSIRESDNPTVKLLELSYPDRPDYGRTCGKALSHVMKERANALVRETSEGFKQMFKICCFSENPKSILMWSHYADYHKGFCIGYNFHELGNGDVRTRSIYPVIYSDEMFDATGVFGPHKSVDNILYLNQAALMKSTEWSYEKEWRLVFGNMLIQKEMSYRMPKPKHVILGARISADNEYTIRKICERKNIEVLKLQMKHNQFVLDIQQ
ncbi:DUF2971 domain-containing protein [Oceanimonas sp. MB9]|uniref:DUF2971 domain-containing protein n=1 Tax=Oceanimonas sp. MB9 TaxID=2588453 RepID=UPI0013F61C29|nr:DUF2971 domain-containing protein [Oceanimonas sp. MB9]NHI00822.1 hypothetical protein [Oceanimonas sp. MB9]